MKAIRHVKRAGRSPKFDNSIYPRKPMADVVQFKSKQPTETPPSEPNLSRWRAELRYQSWNDGGSFSEVFFEEILDLHAIIEKGPDWNTLVSCTVYLNRAAP